ncbi:hypothetical protein ACOSQ3_016352 [Xanthoceras sorbifolium]
MVPYSVSSSVGSGFGCRFAGVACRSDGVVPICGSVVALCKSVGAGFGGGSVGVICRSAGVVSGCKTVGFALGCWYDEAGSGCGAIGVVCRSVGSVSEGCKSAEAICRMFRAVVWCRPVGWMTPPISFLKLNMDATWDKGGCRFGLGMVVRQEGGEVVFAAALFFKGGIVVAVAEATALLEGLVLAGSKGFCPSLIESDSLEVVNLCNSRENILCEIENVISDIRIALGYFDVVSICHVLSVFNSVAHGIASFQHTWAMAADLLNGFI